MFDTEHCVRIRIALFICLLWLNLEGIYLVDRVFPKSFVVFILVFVTEIE